MKKFIILLFFAMLCPVAHSNVHETIVAKNITVSAVRPQAHIGRASWYGPGFFNRRLSSSGRYNISAIFVAHRSYPFGTKLRIINLQNHKVLIAAVEDRGPYIPGRSLDLSWKAAEQLGILDRGVALVSYEVMR